MTKLSSTSVKNNKIKKFKNNFLFALKLYLSSKIPIQKKNNNPVKNDKYSRLLPIS